MVRLLAPLTIPDAVLEEGLGILSAAVKERRQGRAESDGARRRLIKVGAARTTPAPRRLTPGPLTSTSPTAIGSVSQ